MASDPPAPRGQGFATAQGPETVLLQRAPCPHRGSHEWTTTSAPSQDAPAQTAHRTRAFVTPTGTNVHGGALCFMVMGPSLLQRLAVGGWWMVAVGGWRLAVGGWRLVAVLAKLSCPHKTCLRRLFFYSCQHSSQFPEASE